MTQPKDRQRRRLLISLQCQGGVSKGTHKRQSDGVSGPPAGKKQKVRALSGCAFARGACLAQLRRSDVYTLATLGAVTSNHRFLLCSQVTALQKGKGSKGKRTGGRQQTGRQGNVKAASSAGHGIHARGARSTRRMGAASSARPAGDSSEGLEEYASPIDSDEETASQKD